MPINRTLDPANLPPYLFVNGSGDQRHEDQINELASMRYEVLSVVANPKVALDGMTLLVLMHRGY